MKTLREVRKRLYVTMRRVIGVTDDLRYIESQLSSDAWQRYRALEQQAEDECDPIALDALIDQMDRLLDDVAAMKGAQE